MVKHAELKKEHFRQLNQTGRGYFKNVGKDVIGGRASVQGYKECCQPTHAGVGRDTTNDSVFFAGGGAHNKRGGASCHKKNGGGAHNKRGGASCHKKNGGAKKSKRSKKISKVGKLLRKKGKKLSKRVKKLLGGSVCPEQNSVYTHNMNERKFGCKQNECHSAKCV